MTFDDIWKRYCFITSHLAQKLNLLMKTKKKMFVLGCILYAGVRIMSNIRCVMYVHVQEHLQLT